MMSSLLRREALGTKRALSRVVLALILSSPVCTPSFHDRGDEGRVAAKRERISTMVAPSKTRRLVCNVVRVAERPQVTLVPFVRKPSALVPWADPYIAGLVRRLQSEVRLERAALAQPDSRSERAVSLERFDDRGAALWTSRMVVDDLDPPSPCDDADLDWTEAPRRKADGEPTE
jgi:hypothetical protein